jgi:hypothetical protein
MQIPQSNFDAETISLMGRICDEAWQMLHRPTFAAPDGEVQLRSMIANRILSAVALGERNPARLKAIALEHIDG